MLDFFRKKGDSRELTHYVEDGGSLHVPDDKLDEFCVLYADEVMREVTPLCILEKVPEISKLYCWVTFMNERYISSVELVSLKNILMRKVGDYFGGDAPYQALLAFSHTESDRRKFTQVLIVWPDIYVSRQTALDISMSFIPTLEMERFFSNNPLRIELEKCFDESNYRLDVQIPMIFSYRAMRKDVKGYVYNVKDVTLRPLRDTEFRKHDFGSVGDIIYTFSFREKGSRSVALGAIPRSGKTPTSQKPQAKLCCPRVSEYPLVRDGILAMFPQYGSLTKYLNQVTTEDGSFLYFANSTCQNCFNPTHSNENEVVNKIPYFMITISGVSLRCNARTCVDKKQFKPWPMDILTSEELRDLFPLPMPNTEQEEKFINKMEEV